MAVKKYPTLTLNREHPVFKRVKGDAELVKVLSDLNLNRLYMARKVMRGDHQPAQDMYGKAFRMGKAEAQCIIRELTGQYSWERKVPAHLLPFFDKGMWLDSIRRHS